MKAYPFIHKHPTTGNTRLEEGMDLRDYFAAKAMQGDWAAEVAGNNGETMEDSARRYYRMADAMMKAREVKND